MSLALKDALTEEVYMGLVEKRLDKMERFYSNLLSENYPLRRDTWIEARRLFGIQKDLMERFEIPADLPPVPPTDPGLYLVSPRMRRRISARSSGIGEFFFSGGSVPLLTVVFFRRSTRSYQIDQNARG